MRRLPTRPWRRWGWGDPSRVRVPLKGVRVTDGPADRADLLEQLSQVDLLDLGAGIGGSLASAEKRFGGVVGLGIERNARKVQEAQSAGRRVLEGDLFDVPAGAEVRFSVFDNVLEHLPDLDSVRAALAKALEITTHAVYIRHPSFEHEDYLRGLGVKQYWTDWSGHPSHIRIADFLAMFEGLGALSIEIHPVQRAWSTADATMLPVNAPANRHEYDPQLDGPKPDEIRFDRPIHAAWDLLVRCAPVPYHLEYDRDPVTSDRRPWVVTSRREPPTSAPAVEEEPPNQPSARARRWWRR